MKANETVSLELYLHLENLCRKLRDALKESHGQPQEYAEPVDDCPFCQVVKEADALLELGAKP